MPGQLIGQEGGEDPDPVDPPEVGMGKHPDFGVERGRRFGKPHEPRPLVCEQAEQHARAHSRLDRGRHAETVFMAMPVIGAAATVGFTIAGQQIVSMLIDRFGWLGLPRNAVSRARLAGTMVLLAGVVSIKLF